MDQQDTVSHIFFISCFSRFIFIPCLTDFMSHFSVQFISTDWSLFLLPLSISMSSFTFLLSLPHTLARTLSFILFSHSHSLTPTFLFSLPQTTATPKEVSRTRTSNSNSTDSTVLRLMAEEEGMEDRVEDTTKLLSWVGLT